MAPRHMGPFVRIICLIERLKANDWQNPIFQNFNISILLLLFHSLINTPVSPFHPKRA